MVFKNVYVINYIKFYFVGAGVASTWIEEV